MASNKKKFAGIAGGALAAAALVAALVVPTATADFSASDTGRVDVSAASLTVGLTDNKNTAGSFDLDFVNLTPGQTQSQVFYVTNTGSIPANVSIGAPITAASVTPGNSAFNVGSDMSELRVGISNYQALVPVTSMPAQVGLGTLQPGEQRAYTVNFEFASSAGNEWQNATVGATATVTLKQQ